MGSLSGLQRKNGQKRVESGVFSEQEMGTKTNLQFYRK